MALKERFFENQIKNPLWSDYICFANAIRQSDSYQDVTREFELVDKNDYLRSEKEEILQYLKSRFATPQKTPSKTLANTYYLKPEIVKMIP